MGSRQHSSTVFVSQYFYFYCGVQLGFPHSTFFDTNGTRVFAFFFLLQPKDWKPQALCGGAGAPWVIMRDDGSLFISCRTLAAALEYARPLNLAAVFKETAHPPVERGSFPAACLAYRMEDKPHLFLCLSHLMVVLNKKYLQRVCDITGCVMAFIGRKALSITLPMNHGANLRQLHRQQSHDAFQL